MPAVAQRIVGQNSQKSLLVSILRNLTGCSMDSVTSGILHLAYCVLGHTTSFSGILYSMEVCDSERSEVPIDPIIKLHQNLCAADMRI